MKRLMIFLGVIASLLIACENEDYPVYNVSQKDGVFLAYDESTDSVFYNFGFDSKTVYGVTIKLLGMPRDYDRTVKLKVNSGKYASEEFIAAKEAYYDLPAEFTFPADSVQATIPVKLIRDAELENTRTILTFELEDSDDLLVRGHSESRLPLMIKSLPSHNGGPVTSGGLLASSRDNCSSSISGKWSRRTSICSIRLLPVGGGIWISRR